MNSLADSGKLFRAVFPDIAKSFQYVQTNAGYVATFGLALYFWNELLSTPPTVPYYTLSMPPTVLYYTLSTPPTVLYYTLSTSPTVLYYTLSMPRTVPYYTPPSYHPLSPISFCRCHPLSPITLCRRHPLSPITLFHLMNPLIQFFKKVRWMVKLTWLALAILNQSLWDV